MGPALIADTNGGILQHDNAPMVVHGLTMENSLSNCPSAIFAAKIVEAHILILHVLDCSD